MSFFLSLSSSFSVSVSPSLSLCLHLSTYLFISLPLHFSLSDSLPLPFSPTSLLSHSLSLYLSQGIIVKSQAIPAGLPTQFCAAFGAGFFMACTVAPFDMVRQSESECVCVSETSWFFLSIFHFSHFPSFFYSSSYFLFFSPSFLLLSIPLFFSFLLSFFLSYLGPNPPNESAERCSHLFRCGRLFHANCKERWI